jgi:hypothetical protein
MDDVINFDFINRWVKDRKDNWRSRRQFILNWSKGMIDKIYVARNNRYEKPTPETPYLYRNPQHAHIRAGIVDNNYLTV